MELVLTLAVLAILLGVSCELAGALDLKREYYLRSEKGTQFLWRRRRDLPEPRSDFALAPDSRNDYMYMVGGCSGQNVPDCNKMTDGIWRYDQTTDDYVNMKPLSKPRYRHGAVVMGDSLYVFGGLGVNDTFIDQIEVLHIKTNTCKW